MRYLQCCLLKFCLPYRPARVWKLRLPIMETCSSNHKASQGLERVSSRPWIHYLPRSIVCLFVYKNGQNFQIFWLIQFIITLSDLLSNSSRIIWSISIDVSDVYNDQLVKNKSRSLQSNIIIFLLPFIPHHTDSPQFTPAPHQTR